MATIPEVRERLERIAQLMGKSSDFEIVLAAADVEQCVKDLYRRRVFRRAPVKAPVITPEIVAGVRALAKASPNMQQMEIGARFGINAGRVSEILRGKRR